MSKAEKKRYFLQQNYFEEGENTGHLLAMVTKGQQESTSITEIRKINGEVSPSTTVILDTFQQFYADLYTSKTQNNPSDLALFLRDCTFPQVSAAEKESLDSLITIEELIEALAEAPNHKSPGSDGLPVEVYTRYPLTSAIAGPTRGS